MRAQTTAPLSFVHQLEKLDTVETAFFPHVNPISFILLINTTECTMLAVAYGALCLDLFKL